MVGLLRVGLPTSTIPYGKPHNLEDRLSFFCAVDANGIWRYLSCFFFFLYVSFLVLSFYPLLVRTGHLVGKGLDCIQLKKLSEGKVLNLQGIIIITWSNHPCIVILLLLGFGLDESKEFLSIVRDRKAGACRVLPSTIPFPPGFSPFNPPNPSSIDTVYAMDDGSIIQTMFGIYIYIDNYSLYYCILITSWSVLVVGTVFSTTNLTLLLGVKGSTAVLRMTIFTKNSPVMVGRRVAVHFAEKSSFKGNHQLKFGASTGMFLFLFYYISWIYRWCILYIICLSFLWW